MKRVLIDKESRYYKANLHTHSNFSDGHHSPEELKEEYKKRGYSILAITDHEHVIDHSYLSDEDFLMITGCELAIKEFERESTHKNLDMKITHLNLYALDPHNAVTPCHSSIYDHLALDKCGSLIKHNGEFQREYSAKGVNEIIRIASEQGFLVSYNHPSWSLENACDYHEYSGLFAVEIYNHARVLQSGMTDEIVLDEFWRAGKPVMCLCSDDSHSLFDADGPVAFGGFTMINAKSLNYKDVMFALKTGNFYASSGPEIKSLIIEDNIVKVEFSDCVMANIITRGRRAKSVRAKKDGAISYAEFELRDGDGYFRITVTDKSGKKAYTQIYEI